MEKLEGRGTDYCFLFKPFLEFFDFLNLCMNHFNTIIFSDVEVFRFVGSVCLEG